MGNVLDKVRKFKASRSQGGSSRRVRGIFHNWKDTENVVRLVDEFLEVWTHFIAPAPKRNERGLCRADAFQGNEGLPQVVNCLNWDIEAGVFRKKKVCPICRLNNIAFAALKDNPTPEEKEFLEKLRMATSARRNVKWNIIDRADPYVVAVENGVEQRVLGLKIATIGMEAFNDIEGIFEQCMFDITDPDKGIDIKIVKGSNGTRTTYTAQAILEGTSLKQTPLTEEERALVPHELKAICGKQVDIDMVMDALHEDLRQMLDVDGSDAVEPPVEEVDAEVAAAAEAAAAEGSVEATVEAPVEVAAEEEPPAPAPAPAPRPAARPAPVAAKPAPAPAARPAPAQAARPAAAPAARPAPAAAARPAPVAAKPAPAPAARPAAAPAARPAPVAAKPAPAPAARPAPVAPKPAVKVPARPQPAKPAPAPVADETAAAVEEAIEEGGDGLMEDESKKE